MKTKPFIYAAMLGLSLASGMLSAADRQSTDSSNIAKPALGSLLIQAEHGAPATDSPWADELAEKYSVCRYLTAKGKYTSITQCIEALTPIP
jgi:hypothetical protein